MMLIIMSKLDTALIKKMMTLLAQCALLGRSINYLHMLG